MSVDYVEFLLGMKILILTLFMGAPNIALFDNENSQQVNSSSVQILHSFMGTQRKRPAPDDYLYWTHSRTDTDICSIDICFKKKMGNFLYIIKALSL